MSAIEQLARKNIQQLEPYQSARRLGSNGDTWLNANESPFCNHAIPGGEPLNRYSSCQPEPLLAAYAHYAGVSVDQVLTSRGADEGIELLIRTFCEPGQDSIIYCPPTYGMYSICAQTAGVGIRPVPLARNWQLDLPAIEQQLDSVKLVFVCNPNNPTGSLVSLQTIETLLTMTRDRALVVVDEAYIDFCPEASAVNLLARHSNLVILRTLSKAFALAGLRCGFTLAHPQIIQLLLKVIAPYPVPVPVAAIAQQALGEAGLNTVSAQVASLKANRDWLAAQLAKLDGVTVYDSCSNFILVRFPDSQRVFDWLWTQGITLRRTPINQCLRISVGSQDECAALIASLQPLFETTQPVPTQAGN